MDKTKLKRLFKTYGRLWLAYIIFFLALGILKEFFPSLDGEYTQSSMREMLKKEPFKLFILACVFAPIVEEMMFRTLVKPTHNDLILFLCAWPIFIGIRFLPYDVHWGLKIGFAAVLVFVFFTVLKELIPKYKTVTIREGLHKYLWTVVIITSIIFGLVHINNYVDSFTINVALVALIIPRIISGYMMASIKIKNDGLSWAMSLHFLNNFVVVGIGLLAQS